MRKLVVAATFSLLSAIGCDSTDFNIPGPKDLEPGGVYVAYNNGCKQGCDQVQKGDLIQKIDGQPVQTGPDFDAANVTDGQPHKLDLFAAATKASKAVTIVAEKQSLPPLEDVPPFWTVGAQALNQAPEWARRRMFGHASPMVMLVNAKGGILDGRQLVGTKRLMLYWDWSTVVEQGQAVTFMKVLQKAQADLKSRGVEVMFIHVQFPQGRKAPMNDSDLRAFQQEWTEKKPDGTAYEPLPLYRWPNATEFNAARQLGLENAFTVYENLGSSPTIVLMDERGIVRWHSEGVKDPPPGTAISDPAQYTVIEAIKFSLEKL